MTKEKQINQLKKERDNWVDYIRFKLLEDDDYNAISEAAEKVYEIDNEIQKLSQNSD